MNRRTIVFAAPLLAITGCTLSGPISAIPATVVTDINLLAAGLVPVLPLLAPSVPVAALTQVAGYIGQVQAAAAAVAPGMAVALATPSIQTIGQAVSGILSALRNLPLPPQVAVILTAAQVLLPVIEIAVGMAVPAKASAGGMTPAQARAVLAG